MKKRLLNECIEAGCSNKPCSRNLCLKHYDYHRRHGTLDKFSLVYLKPDDRYIKLPSGCWQWTGSKFKNGYGFLYESTKPVKRIRAHRWMYESAKGPIPDGLDVCHSCDNRLCVNPDHLFTGTRKENMEDAVTKLRTAFGERNGKAKLTKEQADEIRANKHGEPQSVLAKRYGVDQSTISVIINRKSRNREIDA